MQFVNRSELSILLGNITKSIKAKQVKFQVYTESLTGKKTLKVTDHNLLFFDPGASNQDVVLPKEGESKDIIFIIFNTGSGNDLIVKEDSETLTIITISQNEGGLLVCNGSVWKGFVAGIT